MTRMDFERIAKVIAGLDKLGHAGHHYVAKAFADELAQTNERFNRARFLKACGVDS